MLFNTVCFSKVQYGVTAAPSWGALSSPTLRLIIQTSPAQGKYWLLGKLTELSQGAMDPGTGGPCKRSMILPGQESSVLESRLKGENEGKIQSLKLPIFPGSSRPMWSEVQGTAGDGSISVKDCGTAWPRNNTGVSQGRVGTFKGF